MPPLRHLLLALLPALAAGLLALGWLRSTESAASRAVHAHLTPAGQPRPLAHVVDAVRALKLVTVELDSRVSSTLVDRSWRGDVRARVETPVRLLYGVDLAAMDVQRLAISPITGGLVVRVPPPARIATELAPIRESTDLQLGWLRFAAISGEFFLARARKDLASRARELALPPSEARRVEDLTRQQLAELISRIVGPGVPVTIIFDDALAPAATLGSVP